MYRSFSVFWVCFAVSCMLHQFSTALPVQILEALNMHVHAFTVVVSLCCSIQTHHRMLWSASAYHSCGHRRVVVSSHMKNLRHAAASFQSNFCQLRCREVKPQLSCTSSSMQLLLQLLAHSIVGGIAVGSKCSRELHVHFFVGSSHPQRTSPIGVEKQCRRSFWSLSVRLMARRSRP